MPPRSADREMADEKQMPTKNDPEAIWTKLEEACKLIAEQADPMGLFGHVTSVRSVVGEAPTVFPDVVRTCNKVRGDESASVPDAQLFDDFESVSMHIIVYLNYTALMEELAVLAKEARVLKSIGMEGSGLRFQRTKPQLKVLATPPPGRTTCNRGGDPSPAETRPPEPMYKPGIRIPLGTLRLRRVVKSLETGNATEVVTKIERLCVVRCVRPFGVEEILMKAAEGIARDAFNVRWAFVSAPVELEAFYRRMGFRPKDDGQRLLEGNLQRVVMVKSFVDASI